MARWWWVGLLSLACTKRVEAPKPQPAKPVAARPAAPPNFNALFEQLAENRKREPLLPATVEVIRMREVVATLAPPPPPAELPTNPTLEVVLQVEATGPVRVTLRIPQRITKQVPGAFSPRFHGFPRAFELLSVKPALFNVTFSAESAFTLSYEVSVPSVDARVGYPLLEGSFDTPKGRRLALSTLVPFFDRGEGSLVLAPATIRVESSLPVTSSLDGRDQTFVAHDMAELQRGVLLVGQATTVLGSEGLRVTSLDFDAQTLARVAQLERQISERLAKLYGPRRPLKSVFIHAAPPERDGSAVLGLNQGDSVSFFSRGPPEPRPTSQSSMILLHELLHSSLPPDHSLPHWLTEGITDYFAARHAVELEGLPAPVLYELLEARWDTFKRVAPSLRAGANPLGDYYGGSALAYCIDVRLRRDQRSLDEVLLRTRGRAADTKVNNELWEQEIALASAPAGALVLNAKTEPIDPIQTCFKEAGLKRAARLDNSWPNDLGRSLLIDSVMSPGSSFDVTVLRVDKGSPFEAGDVITHFNEIRLTSPEQLAELAALMGGSTVAFTVWRDGQRLRITQQLPRMRSPEAGTRQLWVP